MMQRIHKKTACKLIGYLVISFLIITSIITINPPETIAYETNDTTKEIITFNQSLGDGYYVINTGNNLIYETNDGLYLSSQDNITMHIQSTNDQKTVVVSLDDSILNQSDLFDNETIYPIENNTTIIKNPYYNTSDPEYQLSKYLSNISIAANIEDLEAYHIMLSLQDFYQQNYADLIDTYTIKWDDGTSTMGSIHDETISHTYKSYGFYNITITFTGANITVTKQLPFYINPPGIFDYPGLFFKTYPEETVAVTISIGTLSLLGYALTETGKFKLLSFLFASIPMLARIQRNDVLDNFVRGQIYASIKLNPGIHYSKISEKLGIKNGTLSYHLHMLEKTGLIKSRRERFRYRAFYPEKMIFPKEERYRLSDFQIKLLEIIRKNKGINQKNIAEQLKEKPQNINYHIKLFEQAGLVKLVKKGKHKHLYITDKTLDYDLI